MTVKAAMPPKKQTRDPKRSAAPSPVKQRRKADDVRKDLMLRVRVTQEQKRVLTEAAEKMGLDVSSWLRSVGIERARELGVA